MRLEYVVVSIIIMVVVLVVVVALITGVVPGFEDWLKELAGRSV